MMRFGSIKLSETSFPLLASALTFQYLCIRYSRTREAMSDSHSARPQNHSMRYGASGKPGRLYLH